MGIAKTGFWTNTEGTRLYWARWNGSDKRSELWELTYDIQPDDVLESAYVWRDISSQFAEYGFVGYLATLKFQGWTCTQQPNGHTKHLVEMPRLPYPAALLTGGTTDSGWTYTPAVIDEPGADTVGHTKPAEWRCRVSDVPEGADTDVAGLHLPGWTTDMDFFGSAREYVFCASGLYEGDGWFVDDAADRAVVEPVAVESESVEPEPKKAPKVKKTAVKAPKKARKKASKKSRETVAKPACREPAAVTQEIPEIPPKTTGKAVVYATVPTLVKARDIPEMAGMGYPRYFRDSNRRKVAYVAANGDRCVIAYRDRYARGSDAALEKAVADYVAGLGFDLGKAA